MILTTDAEIRAAVRRGKSLPKGVSAIAATYLPESDHIAVTFDNGLEMRFPRAPLKELQNASPEQLSQIEICAGSLLAWDGIVLDPALNMTAAYDIPELIDQFAPAGRAMNELGRLGGSTTSPKKRTASPTNGKKGGRPRKQHPKRAA